ncbi:MAG: PQQ-binding-like beta-propeller repeat protein, partial [Phycisphaerales bacterium]|nr:PQQ-binding-like beta-propeller repeat protein [Phycisphaerales bacterium]
MRSIRITPFVLAMIASSAARADDDFLDPAALRDAGLAKYWQLRLPLESEQTLTDAYLVDDVIYASTNDGYVFSVHANTGAVRWMRSVTRSGYRIPRPCHTAADVAFVTPTKIRMYEKYAGDATAEIDLNFPAGSGAATDGNLLFFGGVNQRFYAYGLDTLMERWKAGTNGPISSTPVLYDRYLFVASQDSGVYACVAANKQFQWQRATTGPITADLAVDENGVYVPSRDQSLYLLDFESGRVRWRARFSGPLYEPPVLSVELAYQYCPDDGVVAVEVDPMKDEPRLRWKIQRGRSLLTVDGNRAHILTRDDAIQVVSTKDGAYGPTIAAPGFTLPIPSPKNFAVLVGSPDGRLFCARAKDAPPLTAAEVTASLYPPTPTTTMPSVATTR